LLSYNRGVFLFEQFLKNLTPLAFLVMVTGLATVSAQGEKTNVVLITIDTLRADYVSCYGQRPGLTPALDSLAADGVLFSSAYCQVPMTPPSHASILTGLYPATHGLRDFASGRMRGDIPTLATVLKGKGYDTAAFVSAFVLDRSWGLSPGFDLYYDDFPTANFETSNPGNVQRRAEETVDHVLDWLANSKPPYFLWVHLFDPHHDYDPPEPFRSRHQPDLYAGEVAYADSQIGRIAKRLKELGQYDDSLIIATSDHGESLGEHGEEEHGFFLYESSLRVPLILKLPSEFVAPSRKMTVIAETVDILPTTLQVLRVPSQDLSMEGKGLLSAILGKRAAEGTAYAETLYPETTFGWSRLRALWDGSHKLVEAPTPELYNLDKDPLEEKNLFSTSSALANQLRSRLLDFEDRFESSGTSPHSEGLDERTERLRSLGYVSVVQPRSGSNTLLLPDPKDKIGVYNQVLKGLQAAEAGKLELSNSMLGALAEQNQDLFILYHQMGLNSLKLGREQEAIASLRRAHRLNPDFSVTAVNLARVLSRQGEMEEAIQLLEGREGLSAKRQLAMLFSRSRRFDEAIHLYEEVLRSREDDPQALKLLGIAQVEIQDYRSGLETLNRSIELGGDDALVRNFHGIAQANLGNPGEALASYRKAIEMNPRYPQPRLNLALSLLDEGRKEEAVAEFDKLCGISQVFCERYRDRFR
jgi:arylsulfatase A-like enzyme/Flp pilus assembly protein TadD